MRLASTSGAGTVAVLQTATNRFILPACAAVIALVLAAVLVPHFHWDTGLTSLIRMGERDKDKLPPELAGVPVYLVPHRGAFDGQYYAHMALHPPWMYHDLSDHYDFPAYRLRRVFLPTLAWVLGLGRPAWVIHLFSWFNLLAWCGLAWLLTAWLPLEDWTNFGRWAGCLLAAGVLESLRGALCDLPSLLLLLVGVRLWERQPRSGALAWTASILSRDTMALSVLGLLWPAPPDRRGFVRLAVVGGSVVGPAALWALYVAHYFPTNVMGVSGNLRWPFHGTVEVVGDAWEHLRRGVEDNGRYTFRLVSLAALGLQAWVILANWRQGPRWLRVALPSLLFFPFLGEPVLGGPWGLWRGMLPVTISFCFLVPPGRWFAPLLLAGSLPSLLAMFRLIF